MVRTVASGACSATAAERKVGSMDDGLAGLLVSCEVQTTVYSAKIKLATWGGIASVLVQVT
eukprot:1797145-Prymnesium_polylepis.2